MERQTNIDVRTLNQLAVGAGLPLNGMRIRYGSPTEAVISLWSESNRIFGAPEYKHIQPAI